MPCHPGDVADFGLILNVLTDSEVNGIAVKISIDFLSTDMSAFRSALLRIREFGDLVCEQRRICRQTFIYAILRPNTSETRVFFIDGYRVEKSIRIVDQRFRCHKPMETLGHPSEESSIGKHPDRTCTDNEEISIPRRTRHLIVIVKGHVGTFADHSSFLRLQQFSRVYFLSKECRTTRRPDIFAQEGRPMARLTDFLPGVTNLRIGLIISLVPLDHYRCDAISIEAANIYQAGHACNAM